MCRDIVQRHAGLHVRGDSRQGEKSKHHLDIRFQKERNLLSKHEGAGSDDVCYCPGLAKLSVAMGRVREPACKNIPNVLIFGHLSKGQKLITIARHMKTHSLQRITVGARHLQERSLHLLLERQTYAAGQRNVKRSRVGQGCFPWLRCRLFFRSRKRHGHRHGTSFQTPSCEVASPQTALQSSNAQQGPSTDTQKHFHRRPDAIHKVLCPL